MSAALKIGRKPGAHDGEGQLLGHGALADRENVAVVMRAVPDRELFVPANPAPDSALAVGHDGFAVARPAEDNAALKLAARDGLRDRSDEIGVVAGGIRIGAEIA